MAMIFTWKSIFHEWGFRGVLSSVNACTYRRKLPLTATPESSRLFSPSTFRETDCVGKRIGREKNRPLK